MTDRRGAAVVACCRAPHHAPVTVHASFVDRVRASCADGTFVKLLLSAPADAAQAVQRIAVRLAQSA